MKSSYYLRRWLAREVLGREIPRKPPGKARRGPARDEDYKAWIRTHPCAACGSWHSVEAAHVGSDGGMSQKATDELLIPLCTDCHTMEAYAYHRDRGRFARRFPRLDCAARARELWADYLLIRATATRRQSTA